MYSDLISGFALPYSGRYKDMRLDAEGKKVSIDTITIHHMAGNMTAENCVKWMSRSDGPLMRSCNYAIGSDGQIWGGAPEEGESYCSSDRANDKRAVTIEVANDGGEESGWHISDDAMNALIRLCADICVRNNIASLTWREDDASYAYHPEVQNISLHKWFSATPCPGPYLISQMPAIARRVNKLIDQNKDPSITVTDDEISSYKKMLAYLLQKLEE